MTSFDLTAVTLLATRRGRMRQVTTLCGRALRTSLRVARQGDAQLGPRGDPELWEDAVEVRAHRAMRQVEPLADLAVRQALRRKLRDLQLLSRQIVARLAGG